MNAEMTARSPAAELPSVWVWEVPPDGFDGVLLWIWVTATGQEMSSQMSLVDGLEGAVADTVILLANRYWLCGLPEFP